jgi:uncharacterized protein YrzB (UPF0473 family)
MAEYEEDIEIFTDDEGNAYYVHRMIDIGDKQYAILVYIEDEDEDEEGCGCGCGCSGEAAAEDDEEEECEVEIARVETDEAGEQVFVFIDPDDPEYDKVCEAYEKLAETEN